MLRQISVTIFLACSGIGGSVVEYGSRADTAVGSGIGADERVLTSCRWKAVRFAGRLAMAESGSSGISTLVRRLGVSAE